MRAVLSGAENAISELIADPDEEASDRREQKIGGRSFDDVLPEEKIPSCLLPPNNEAIRQSSLILAYARTKESKQQEIGIDTGSTGTQPSISTVAKIHDELLKEGHERYCVSDENAFVLSNGVGTQPEQRRLLHFVIESADKFVVITSYAVRPTQGLEEGMISDTSFSFLESLAKRQDDKDFTFVFLYNKSEHWQNALIWQKRTDISMNPAQIAKGKPSWQKVIKAYNQSQKEESLKIRNLNCNIFFVAAQPKGLGGSNHNKFYINDNGVVATLGANTGSINKPTCFDSGCIVLSKKLASSQRHYFCDEMLKTAGHYSRLSMRDGEPLLVRLQDTSEIQESIRSLTVSDPIADGEIVNERLKSCLEENGLSSRGTKAEVLFLQNAGSGYRNMFSERRKINKTPVGSAVCQLFDEAKPGDTLKLINKHWGSEGRSLVAHAVGRGVNVQIVTEQKEYERFNEMARKLKGKGASDAKPGQSGQLTVLPCLTGSGFANRHGLNAIDVPHGKTYILMRTDGSQLITTGTYNLNGHSHWRSQENLMLIQTEGNELTQSLFDELWESANAVAKRMEEKEVDE